MDVVNLVRVDGFGCGSVGPLAISVWDEPPTERHARHAAELLSEVGARHSGVLVLAVVGESTPPPNNEVREILGVAMSRLVKAGKVLAASQVVEGQGFRAAAIRGVLIGMGIVIRPQHPEKVFATVLEAATFLAEKSDGQVSSRDIIRAVDAIREAGGR